jgi:hypothetical protein
LAPKMPLSSKTRTAYFGVLKNIPRGSVKLRFCPQDDDALQGRPLPARQKKAGLFFIRAATA